MKALGKYIVIKPEKVEEQVSASGLLLTAADSEGFRYHEAKVLFSGPEVDEAISEGVTIAYDKNAGHPFRIGEDSVRIILERDCALIL